MILPVNRNIRLFFILFCLIAVPFGQGYAARHLWTISQVYSDEDGSVQFIELFVCCSGENFVQNAEVVTHRDGGQDEQRFTIPADVSGNTAGRHILLATGPISGVDPDFVIPENFVPVEFDASATVNISSWAWQGNPNIVTYNSIPTDGFLSIDGHGNIQDPATVTNFSGDTATVVPPEPPEPPELPEIRDLSFSDGSFSLAFTTEEGRAYTVEYRDTLQSGDWGILTVIEGTGNVESASDSTPGAETPQRFYRVTAE